MRLLFVAGALAAAGLLVSSHRPAECEVTLELKDAATGKTLPGLLRVENAAGQPVALQGLLNRGLGMDPKLLIGRWSVIVDRATVRLPREKLTLEAFHGLETKLVRVELDLTGREKHEAKVPLVRFHAAGKRGYRAGNTHLHLMKLPREAADRYLREIPRADGLEVVFLSYLERAEADRDYISNRYTGADLEELSKTGVLFGNGEEHRHNFGAGGEGYGHVMLLDIRKLIQPVSIGPGITKAGTDGLPLRAGIDEARRDGATIVWCHNTFGTEDIPSWATGRVHAQNIFDGGTHGSYKDTFYRYLDAALRVPFSTGTDWFIYDFSRVYAHAPDLASPKDFLRALQAGKSFITNGPLLDFEVEGQPPGATLRLARPGQVRLTARAVGRSDFQWMQLVRNGEVVVAVKSKRGEGRFSADLEAEVHIPSPSWLALRVPPVEKEGAAPLNELGRSLFAHTSPVYVEVGGRPRLDPAVVRGLIEEVRRNRKLIGEKAEFADDAERARVLAVYDDGIAALEKLLRE